MCWGFGDTGAVLISYWPSLCPYPHYIHYTVPDVFRKYPNELAELWFEKYYVCIFSQRVFQWIIYLQLCICLTEGSLCDFKVWKEREFCQSDDFQRISAYFFWGGERRQLTLNQHATRLQYIARGEGTLELWTWMLLSQYLASILSSAKQVFFFFTFSSQHLVNLC